ncbi:LytTR family transcriptional regulator, partial [Vibrio parahaemolyticus]
VYPQDGHFFTAEAMIRQHVVQVHHGALAALVAQPAGQLGVSSSQQTVLQLFAQGLSDTVIAQRLKVSPSTIR